MKAEKINIYCMRREIHYFTYLYYEFYAQHVFFFAKESTYTKHEHSKFQLSKKPKDMHTQCTAYIVVYVSTRCLKLMLCSI
jgi:hypothetical protein